MQRGFRDKTTLPRVNLRILVFCALGLIFGIFLYFRIRFGGLKPSDFLFFTIFLACSLVPFEKKRVLAIVAAFLLFVGAGALSAHLSCENFLSGAQKGAYRVTGTVLSFTPQTGGTDVILGDLTFSGVQQAGKFSVLVLGEDVRAGDMIEFETYVERSPLPEAGGSEYAFYSDIRYVSGAVPFRKTGTSGNLLLRLQTALYDRLASNMGGTEAQVAFALLTGNSKGMDEGLLQETRRGGIAHIFAVSGLHIGILFGAAMLLFRPLKRYAVLPSCALAVLYAAFCGFTVSSVRAVLMCSVVGLYRAFGRKYDFLQSVALAALPLLLLFPADFLSAGFRLSFGACVGLGLFSGSLSRAFKKIRCPAPIAAYLSANLSVQLFTLPILLDAFGYFSLWGFLLNLVLIPLLPVFFLTILLFSLLALAIPPAATFFLAAPKGLLSLFLLILSGEEFTAVLTGFSLGAGSAVYLAGSFLLSERMRLRALPRALLAVALALVLTAVTMAENVVFSGGKLTVYRGGTGSAALVQTPEANVLVIDGTISLADCEDFLARRCGKTLDLVLVLGEDELSAINRAVFLDADEVYARDEVETGLREANVHFAEHVEAGGLQFTFLTREKLMIEGEGVVIELDFVNSAALGADLFVDSGCGGLIFCFENGIIKEL